ncbi:MAG: pyridoxamine 5'-phosphate oxidase family protein [Hyphomonas sp.]|nr:pyridoxamine 5'-phosphate oxidase family protein [Hyphomonas sp.]
MADLKKFDENPQRQLLEEIKSARCVMLGSPKHDTHMQPMAPQVDVEAGVIYFYSDNTSALGSTILARPGSVHMCHIDKDYQACVKGMLTPHDDKATIDRFWSPMVEAWYPGGKTDSKMMMLKFEPQDAAVWASDKSTMGFMFEVAKANATGKLPDVGKTKEFGL